MWTAIGTCSTTARSEWLTRSRDLQMGKLTGKLGDVTWGETEDGFCGEFPATGLGDVL